MRALVCHAFGPIEDLRVEEMPEPVAGPGEVVIDVEASSLNFPDALIVQGLYQMKPSLPFSPGAEVAGTVASIGEGVSNVSVGERVLGFTLVGGFAERCVVDAKHVLPLPRTMPFDLGAAFVLTYCTTLHALENVARLREGETLLVLGAGGGTGTAAVEVGKAMGARVIAAASSEDKLAVARELGADATIDYLDDDLRDRMRAIAPDGANVVYDPVGGDLAEAALRTTAWRGRYLVVGFASGGIPRIPLNLALLSERAILGVHWGAAIVRHPDEHARTVARLLAWFDEGRIRPAVRERIGLGQAADAIARIAARKVVGKIVVEPKRP